MEIFSKIKIFLNKHYWIFLLLVVLISYGLIIVMYPWQDDHAIFFKLAHIQEPAGFLGKGIFGEGAYKYTASFYYPLYLLFGYSMPVYFLLSLIFYFLATYTIYKSFSEVLGEKAGKLSAFIFACGYIASDGFVRLYNSVGTSISIILMTFLLLFYYRFSKNKKIKWYVFAILTFFLASELIKYRTHYLISIVILFELIFLAFRKNLKSFFSSLLRLIPFILIFFQYFIKQADGRTGLVKEVVVAIFNGKIHNLYGFFSSFGNLVFPDWISGIIFNLQPVRIQGLYNYVFESPFISAGPYEKFIFVIGLFVFVLLFYLFIKSRDKKIYLFFLIWIIINLASYWAYEPLVVRVTTNRFLAHSFVALAGLAAVVANKNKLMFVIIVALSLGNLYSSLILNYKILSQRSIPARSFYQDLKQFIPKVSRGDLIYFDISEDSRQEFADFFSVAQMPEETAIAWRYGVDRYDFRMLTDFVDLEKILIQPKPVITDINNQEIPVNNVYTFFYSKGGLVNTTEDFRNKTNNFTKISDLHMDSKDRITEVIFDNALKRKVGPTKIKLSAAMFIYPYSKEIYTSSLSIDQNVKDKAFRYKTEKQDIMRNSKVTVSNYWQGNMGGNMIDRRLTTSWRADRLLWKENVPNGGAILTLDLGIPQPTERFVWVNRYENSSPTQYFLETSEDNKVWEKVAEYNSNTRITPGVLQVIDFPLRRVRHIRMNILKTLDTDSPTISEVWAVPPGYQDIDLNEIEKYIENPFKYISSKGEFEHVLNNISYKSKIKVFWQGDKSKGIVTDESLYIDAIYDGLVHEYECTIPAGGTKIDKIVLEQNAFGKINVNSLQVSD